MDHPAERGEKFRLKRATVWREQCRSALMCGERTEPSPLSTNLTIRAEQQHAIRNQERLSHIVGDQQRCGTTDELWELVAETGSGWRIERSEGLVKEE